MSKSDNNVKIRFYGCEVSLASLVSEKVAVSAARLKRTESQRKAVA
jgi:hypothetical protein